MAFVRAMLDPDTALIIQVGLGQPVRNLHHHDDAPIRLHILGERMHRRAHMLGGGITQ